MTLPEVQTVRRFCGVVESRLGLDLLGQGSHDVVRILRQRSDEVLHLGAEAYVDRLAQGLGEEWAYLVNELTIGETYFFRHVEQLLGCCELIERSLSAVGGRRPVRVLSAGCSSGEEAYSLAMLLQERGLGGAAVEIIGMDVNAAAIERARAGRFTPWALRETDAATAKRWFRREGGTLCLDPRILDAVSFVQANLVGPRCEVLRDFDVVLCRNVLMYFSRDQFRRAAERLVGALRPGGALFLGHAESFRGFDLDVETVSEFGVFHYRSRPARPVNTLSGAVEHAIGASLETSSRSSRFAPEDDSWKGSFVVDLAAVEKLMIEERFFDAFELLEAARSNTGMNAQLALRTSILLVHCNRLTEAAALLESLLCEASIAAEVHYALALCHEGNASVEGALHHNRRAAHLDPTFAMPWLHLGLMHKRLGDHEAARRELLQARALLSAETPERVLWFGGGSSRAGLLDVCQSGLGGGRNAG